jgi:hypothetical protein
MPFKLDRSLSWYFYHGISFEHIARVAQWLELRAQ